MKNFLLCSTLLLTFTTFEIGAKREHPNPPAKAPIRFFFPDGVELISMKSERVLSCVKRYLPDAPVVVEAGAYDGDDTRKMSHLWPEGTIYSFEPVPENFKRLLENSSQSPNVQCFPLALSDRNGNAQFFSSAYAITPNTPSASGSLLKPKEHLKYAAHVIFNKKISVPTITLDDWAQKNNVDHVDLLWLDMQGYELQVLQASPKILKTVTVIYTEVEFVEAYEGQYLYKDIKAFLEKEGFTLVARDFNEPPSYWFGNAVFVRK